MAKWKNALLISTIVAPIAFGASPLGDALAAPKDSRPDTTPVVSHKQITSDTANANTEFWGNGHTNSDGNPFVDANGQKNNWKSAGAGYEFTAYKIPSTVDGTKLITFAKGSDSTPTIADKAVAAGVLKNSAGTDLLWSELIDVVAQPAGSSNHDTSNTNKDYVIQYSLNIEGQYQEAFASWAKTNLGTKVTDTTDASGAAEFTGAKALANGNWVILETGVPSSAGVTTKQQGMVVSLPMMDAYSIARDEANNYWFGSAGVGYAANVLNLYPKDFADKSDVSVLKTDSKSGQKLANFGYTVFVASAADAAAIQEKIATDVKAGGTVRDSLTGNSSVKAVKAEVLTGTDGKTPSISLDPTTDLTVGSDDSYYIVESSVPAAAADSTKYLLDATIQQMIFDEDSKNTTLTADTPTIAFHNAVWDVNNYKPGIDKSITIGSGADTDTSGENVKGGGDTTNGIDRGEDFVWNIVADLSVDASDYNKKYEITDTLPYQTNWTSAKVAVAGIEDVFELQHLMPTATNGGLTGHGISYGNNDNAATAKDTTYDLNGALNSDFLKLTVPAGTYAKLAAVADAATILAANNVTDDASLQTFLNANVTVAGVSSQYHFTENNRLAVKDADGELNIAVQEQGRELFSALAKAQGTVADRVMAIALTAHANSAAQASTTITNDVDFDVENNYDVSTDQDTVKTFDAGWEIVKTDGSGQPLAGAGFDLAVEIPNGDTQADKVKRAALLNNFFKGDISQGTYAGQHVYDEALKDAAVTVDGKSTTIGALWEAMFLDAAKSDQFKTGYNTSGLTSDADIKALAYTSGDTPDAASLYDELVSMMTATDYETDGQNVLYFMHKDAATGAYMPKMDMGATGVVMGDVIWTPVRAWATTHVTGTDGYIQYCGLAAGKYALIEKTAPEGYALIDNEVQLGNETYAHAETFTLGSGAVGDMNGGTGKIDGRPTDDDIHIKNYQKSMFPLVGGIGTLFAVIAGLLAMGLALLKRKKDMKNEA